MSAVESSELHPHEPDIPPTFDAEGRCMICALALEAHRIREGLMEVRNRHLYNCPTAGEALAVWILNGNQYSDWQPSSSDYGYDGEQMFKERMRIVEAGRTA